MAEVLSPSMQPSGSITMMHPRPSSADAFQASSQQYPQSARPGQQTRGVYNGQATGYRGTSVAPVQPYAFQSTPNLRHNSRSLSADITSHGAVGAHRHTHSQSASASSTTSSDVSLQPSAKDDSVMGSRNGSLINLSQSIPDLSLTNYDLPTKPSPNRYRRSEQKRTESGTATPKAVSPQVKEPVAASDSGLSQAHRSVSQEPSSLQQGSVDDIAVNKSGPSELAKRYRHRSLNTLEAPSLQLPVGGRRPASAHGQSATSTPTTIRPVSFHTRQSSNEQENAKSSTLLGPEQKAVTVPPRLSSEPGKRVKTPSPLSKETADPENAAPVASPVKYETYAAAAQAGVGSVSPAVRNLVAVSDKDYNKGMKSRLRHAFSFGRPQELRKTAGENSTDAAAQHAQHAKQQHQQHIDDELDAEQQEIARRQEEAGIGAGIYSGQGGFVTGSTDNISISSTASSASMMLRKMGRGAKKSARSIKGLFRPRSIIGVPAADGPVSAATVTAQPSVSMITVEAERQKVNVTEHPADKHHGITGYPKLERNSIDAANGILSSDPRGSAEDGSVSRRSVVGSDRDRAEVLAAVKKGILKRSGTGSPSGSPVIKPNDSAVQAATVASESPASSMPSTPKDGQSRTESMKNAANVDYFTDKLAAASKGATPGGTNRNISFSPRIQFYDALSATEYDRRGEIATCNRLTPMLAQQIKEELNTFKMEMEVHELSKPHTHFF